MTKWFDNKCKCGYEMYYYFTAYDDEIFWCELCGRMVIVYRGQKPSEEGWHTPKSMKGDSNG